VQIKVVELLARAKDMKGHRKSEIQILGKSTYPQKAKKDASTCVNEQRHAKLIFGKLTSFLDITSRSVANMT
jgi:hypothetical protein